MKITLTLDEAKFYLGKLFAQHNQIAEISIDIPVTEFVEKACRYLYCPKERLTLSLILLDR